MDHSSPILVLLPGMDGTGELFAPLLHALGESCKTRVVAYPVEQALNYAQLEDRVRTQLPGEPYVILAESFSGPLAIALAASRPDNLRGLILCATFARNPHPRLACGRMLIDWLPFSWMSALPVSGLGKLLGGHFMTPTLRAALEQAVKKVQPAVWRARLKAVLDADMTGQLANIDVPVLYLRAEHDQVVPAQAGEDILQRIPHARLAVIDAPHFLLQCKPLEAAEAIGQFVKYSISTQ